MFYILGKYKRKGWVGAGRLRRSGGFPSGAGRSMKPSARRLGSGPCSKLEFQESFLLPFLLQTPHSDSKANAAHSVSIIILSLVMLLHFYCYHPSSCTYDFCLLLAISSGSIASPYRGEGVNTTLRHMGLWP